MCLAAVKSPCICCGSGGELRAGTRCDVAQLEHVVAMAGIGHPPRFCHAEDVWRTTGKSVPLANHQS
ncbi:hypothetical protein ACLK1T_01875 [Escherichia coli]